MSEASSNSVQGRYRHEQDEKILQRLKRYPAINIVVVYGLILLGLAVWTIASRGEFAFFTSLNLSVLAQQIPITAIVAVGVGLLMISGEFDISVAATFTFAAFITATLLQEMGWPFAVAFTAGILSGTVIGATNALITCWLGIPSFIATIGMMFFGRGLVRWISVNPETNLPDSTNFFPHEGFKAALTGQLGGPVFAQLIWLIVVAYAGHLILNRHRLGNHMFSAGGNAEAARGVGVRVRRVKLLAFVICGATAAFAGILQATRISEIEPSYVVISGLELKAIAAVVVGGVALAGGRGTILGMVLGAALIETVDNVLVLASAPEILFKGFLGAIIILAVILNTALGRRQES